jgi:hypothetical protein
MNAMSIEELRDGIWDYLFSEKAARTIDEIAALADQDATAVRAAVEHEWFRVDQDRVTIAYSAPTPREARWQTSY